MSKLAFIGKFDVESRYKDKGVSVAGAEVQKRIISELFKLEKEGEVLAFASQTGQSWPKGVFCIPSKSENGVTYLTTFNVPFIRDFFFALQCLFIFFKHKPVKIIQYNPFPISSLAIIFIKIIFRTRVMIIIQDVALGSGFNWIRQLQDKFSCSLIKYFDRVFPVSQKVATKFGVPANKVTLVKGAMEHNHPYSPEGYEFSNKQICNIVVAGYLSEYNGLKKLMDALPSLPIDLCFHVIGDGPLASDIEKISLIDNRLKFYGKQSKSFTTRIQSSADANVCLRYGKGLSEEYFFPSKFFSVNCFTGFVIVNDFYGIPEGYKKIGFLVDQDLSNLGQLISNLNDLRYITSLRQEYLFKNYNWESIVQDMICG